jgi:hypothetical protein
MADWKKIVVSGSSAELAALKVDNLSSGVVTGAAGNLTTTAVNGTGNIVATTGATNVVMTGSFTGSFAGDGSGLTGVTAAAGFSLSEGEGISPFSYNGSATQTVAVSGAAQLSDNAITKWNNTDGKFVNSSITDNGTSVSISSNTKITGSLEMLLTGSSTFEIQGNNFQQTYLTTAGALVLNPGSGGVGMAGSNQYIQANYFIGTTAGTVLTGSFSGSFKGDGSGLTGIATASYANNATSASYANNATSASFALTASYAENANADLAITGSNGSSGSVNLKTQGLTITGTSNEIETSVAGQTVTIGLPNDVTIGNNLIVNNNLTVLGTASFQNTENLEVADRFILLASGSNTSGDGGLVIQQGTQNVGELFAFDSGVTRWGFTSSFNAASSSFTPDAFVAAAIDGGVGSDPTAINARYQAKGNIFVGADESIWIYS